MATTEETKIPLRIVVDKEKKKVVFAEANNDFVDILFSFLTLPMGTIVKLLGKHSDSRSKTIGSMSTLYEGMANLDPKYFWTEECKDMLLNPRNSSEAVCCKLKLNIDDTKPTKYFICEDCGCSQGEFADLSTYNTARCNCGKLMTTELGLKDFDDNTGHGKAGVFTIESTTFIISDDLHVMPNLSSSTLGLLNNLGIRDMRMLEEKTLNIGFKEILDLLKLSLFSRTPLTDMFFIHFTSVCKKHIISDAVKSEPGNLAQPQNGNRTTNNSWKMTLKVMVQKSNNKALFAEAQENFIDFLFSLLTIPLGSVVSLLSGDTSLGCMDNLYKSISNLNVGRHMKSLDLKNMLHQPQLPPKYPCKNQIFPLNEQHTQFYCYITNNSGKYSGFLRMAKGLGYYNFGAGYHCSSLKDPKVQGGFVREPTMFMVTDELDVTPMSSISSISFLNRMKIPFNDVDEQVVNIGIEEALSLLKASLNSTSALTNGLNLILKKPKLEN